MTITHLGSDSRESSRQAAHDGNRTPPHDLLAEQSTLGGMMLSKDAVADVVETVRGADFYIPKHEIIFGALYDLYSAGEPTDVIAVTDQLTKTGDLQRAGGADYLHTLVGLVPTAANAGYYAEIVAERAVLRRLVEAGTRIVQMGYGAEGEVVELVNQAQAEIYGVTGGVEPTWMRPRTATGSSRAYPRASATSTRSRTDCIRAR
jgi:replicative DNA helicase